MANVHSGHRARLKQRFAREGLDGFEPHEVLELMLYSAIPQRNVNPLAHALIERFGSLGGVLCASVDELIQVPGVGEKTALWLTGFMPAVRCYQALSLDSRPKLNRLSRVSVYAVNLLMNQPGEQVWTLNMTTEGHLLNTSLLATGREAMENLPEGAILECTLRSHAKTVILLQKRDKTRMTPSAGDVQSVTAAARVLSCIGALLVDSLMVCGHRVLSLHERGLLKYDPSRDWPKGINSALAEHWLE